MLAEGHITPDLKMSGYYEADFLSAGITSNNNQSNSYTLRNGRVGADSSHDWTFTGGQMWSLVTETKKGMDNRSEALPMTINPRSDGRLRWARQAGVRLVRNFDNHFWIGASIENPQTTLTTHNNASNFALGGPGNSSGLYNGGGTPTGSNLANYSFNATPDFIIKAALEPGFGHWEVFAIGSRFRDRVYPCVEATGNPICNGVLRNQSSWRL